MRSQVLLNKSLSEFRLCDRLSEQLRYSLAEELLFEDLTHARALLRVLDEHVGKQVLQVLAVGARDGGVAAAQDLEHQALHGVGVERVPQRHHLVQYAAKGPNVGFLVVGLFLAYLRTQVVWGTDGSLGAVVCVLQHPCNAKVSNLDLVVLGHEDILGL